MIRIIDRLVIKSFIPPFIVTFAIAVFFFLMQTLWFYIDDIAGKGLGFFFIIELLAYKCVGLIPMALPLAILISSVMVMGNLAENYELSSIKSAGVPLLRVMRPLIVFGVLSALVSYYCSATLIPLANLKFGSRMYDIQQQKPALRLDEGVFNDDFQGFTIHIGEKGRDGQTIKEVLIYDHSEASKGQYSQIVAENGKMYITPDGKYFVMTLDNVNQYIEVQPSGPTRNNGQYPFVRTSFRTWTKVFDMNEFSLNRTNEELFKSNKSMMSIPELVAEIDSLDVRVEDRVITLSAQLASYFSFLPPDSTYTYQAVENKPEKTIQHDSAIALQKTEEKTVAKKLIQPASSDKDSARVNVSPSKPQVPSVYHRSLRSEKLTIDPQTGQKIETGRAKEIEKVLEKRKQSALATQAPEVISEADSLRATWDKLQNFREVFEKNERLKMYDRAKTFVLSIQNQAESAVRSIQTMREAQVKYTYEMWTKYSIAVVCIIFVFVGAPMGAIVRKGGVGYPILISIIFFMVFVILTIFCRKIAEAFVLPAMAAAWVPAFVMFPVGLILTFKAMNDSSLQISETVTRVMNWFAKRRAKA